MVEAQVASLGSAPPPRSTRNSRCIIPVPVGTVSPLKVGVEGTDGFGSRRRAASPLQVVVRPPWTRGQTQATRASAGQAASSRADRWGQGTIRTQRRLCRAIQGGLVHVYVEPVPVGTRYRREGPEVGAWLRGSAAERGRGHRRLRSRQREDEQGLGKVSARTRCVRSRAEQAAPSHGTQARCRAWSRLCGSGTQATRSEGLLWLSSGSRGDADPGFGFGFRLPCLSTRSQIA